MLTKLGGGYESDCGTVELYCDQNGRIGALRDGRFYPGIPGNAAYAKYLKENPELMPVAVSV